MAQCRVFVPLHPDLSERFHGDVPIKLSWTLEQSHSSVAAHHHGLEDRHREIAIHHTLLWKVTDLGSMVTAKLIAGAIENMQMPFERSHQPQHSFAECCLARSVRADHPDEFSGVDREGDIFQ